MKIAITGGTGFIGYRLAERLAGKGHDLYCLVRKTSDTKRLSALPVELVNCDILDEGELSRCFMRLEPDAVFHCAAAVESRDEKELLRVNTISTRNVCEASLRFGAGRVIYLSSIAVVNGNGGAVLTDSMPYLANSPYGRSKISAELAALEYREKGLKVAVIRPCMVYGEDEPHALGFILKLASKRLLMLPDIPQADARLHMAYVGNVTQLLEIALYSDRALEGTFIVADAQVTTAREFFKSIYDVLGLGEPPMIPRWVMNCASVIPPVRKKINKIFKDRIYDISRAQLMLGYRPEVSLQEGLRRTIEHWKLTGQNARMGFRF